MNDSVGLLDVEKRQLLKAVKKRNGNVEEFSVSRIEDALVAAFESIGRTDIQNAKNVVGETIKTLSENENRVPSVDDINRVNIETLAKMGFADVAFSYQRYSNERSKIRVLGAQQSKGSTDGFLMVTSISQEISQSWDREKIILSIINETNLDFKTAERIAKEVENKLILSKFPFVTTQLIREIAHTEILKRGLNDASDRYKNFSIPRSDLEEVLFSKNKENSNIQMNNPEAVNFTISGRISKEYALSAIFSRRIAQAHTSGMVHLHDLDLPTRVYCSAHSLEYLKKYGLNLDNLQTASGPAKHTQTLTGHLNTFFAAMQAFYAGALGVGYVNIFYAPLIQFDLEEIATKKLEAMMQHSQDIENRFGKNSSANLDALDALREQRSELKQNFESNPIGILSEEEIDDFMVQKGQELIFAASQNAFSRGGQTLFIDFNIHTGVPSYLKDTLAVEPGGVYAIKRDGKKISLIERKQDEKLLTGYHLIELLDPKTEKVLMREKIKDNAGAQELIQEWFLEENEKPVTYADYDPLSKRFAKNLLNVWRKGDLHGQPFAFPKCDLHISEETFSDPEQMDILNLASEISSENGTPYFIFDRDEVSLAACCRLRTAISDNYVLKHPESLRFCGFQNVTINLPQAAYRAARDGAKNLDGFFEKLDEAMDIVVQAHLEKKAFIDKIQKPGLPQWLTGKPCCDGVPYVDIEKATYIIGIIGLNEAVEFLTGKELQDQTSEEFKNYSLKTIAHMNIKAKEYTAKLGLKFSLEESPAESAARRMSKIDLNNFEESIPLIKGSVEDDQTYYTNSIHIRADAPVDLISRIEMQSRFHPAIESGAIIHAFIGEEKPNPNAITYLVKKTYEKTQTAQITISPEFTICKKCSKTHRGLFDKCPSCGNDDKMSLKNMTRIVGYYSFIDNWNPSKKSELEARHNGYYSVMNAGGMSNNIPRFMNESNGILAVNVGIRNCPLCDDLKSVSSFRTIVDRYGVDFKIESYEADNEDGLAIAMLLGVNLSALPALFLFGEDSELIFKEETKSKDGIPQPIDLEQVKIAMTDYLDKKSVGAV